jgi:hypothetical protein
MGITHQPNSSRTEVKQLHLVFCTVCGPVGIRPAIKDYYLLFEGPIREDVKRPIDFECV